MSTGTPIAEPPLSIRRAALVFSQFQDSAFPEVRRYFRGPQRLRSGEAV